VFSRFEFSDCIVRKLLEQTFRTRISEQVIPTFVRERLNDLLSQFVLSFDGQFFGLFKCLFEKLGHSRILHPMSYSRDMYIPKHFELTDTKTMHDLMRQFSFATIVSVHEDAPFATHMPVVVRPELGEFGTLRTHIARANPQWESFPSDSEILVIFQGDHTYISPKWYETHPSVPTWNYVTVHAYGKPKIVEEPEQVRKLLDELIGTYEGEQGWNSSNLSAKYMVGMMRGIVAFEIEITRLEGKIKLSQNRSEADRQGVVRALATSTRPDDQAIASKMNGLLP
jgi:transcriptional regulator